MANLFSEALHLNLPDSDLIYYPNFFDTRSADSYFAVLREQTPWQQDDITVFGKKYAQPRLTALYANNDKAYSYSSISMRPHVFTKELLQIKDGKDSNGWHADNEKELGQNPIIASITLGEERFFHLKHRTNKNLKHKLLLEHGSLLLMKGATQHHWLHQIPKTAKPIQERINLTFRVVY